MNSLQRSNRASGNDWGARHMGGRNIRIRLFRCGFPLHLSFTDATPNSYDGKRQNVSTEFESTLRSAWDTILRERLRSTIPYTMKLWSCIRDRYPGVIKVATIRIRCHVCAAALSTAVCLSTHLYRYRGIGTNNGIVECFDHHALKEHSTF